MGDGEASRRGVETQGGWVGKAGRWPVRARRLAIMSVFNGTEADK